LTNVKSSAFFTIHPINSGFFKHWCFEFLISDSTHDLEKVFKKYDIVVAGKLGDLLGNQKDKNTSA
jgi:hypothetical protein